MRAKLEEIIRLHGQEISVVRREGGEEEAVRGFLQPLLKEREDPPAAVTPLGAVNEQRWLYIGPAGLKLDVGDRMRCGGMRLIVQEAMTVRFREEALYCRAVLRQEKEVAV